MKYSLLLSFCILFVFSSCKKNGVNNPPDNILTTVNGVNVNFSTSLSASLDTTDVAVYGSSIFIYGQTGTSTNKASISIAISSFNASGLIATGTYNSFSTFNPFGFCNISYKEAVPNLQTGAMYGTDPSGYYESTVTVTASSRTNIQGTFSGRLVSSLRDTTTRAITNGKFSVAIK